MMQGTPDIIFLEHAGQQQAHYQTGGIETHFRQDMGNRQDVFTIGHGFAKVVGLAQLVRVNGWMIRRDRIQPIVKRQFAFSSSAAGAGRTTATATTLW